MNIWKRRASACGLLLLLCSPPALARGYEGYQDELGNAPWYDGSRARIQYQDTVVVVDVAVWSGIDDGRGDDIAWIQGGWGKRGNASAKVYWEYRDKDGQWELGEDIAPAAEALYVQQRNGDQVEWLRDGVIYKTVPWNQFNTVNFMKAQFTAEANDPPADHIPGTLASKNQVSAAQVRRGVAYADAPLAIQSLPEATNGHVEKGDEANTLRTWYAED